MNKKQPQRTKERHLIERNTLQKKQINLKVKIYTKRPISVLLRKLSFSQMSNNQDSSNNQLLQFCNFTLIETII